MFMDCMRKQTYQCAQYKLKIVTKHDSRNTVWHVCLFLRFPCCSTRENISTCVSFIIIGLTLTKLGRFLFSGYRQTGFWNHAGTQISTQSSKIGVSCRSLYASPDDRDA